MNYSKPHSIVVDQSGVRYMDEAVSYMECCQKMLQRHETVPVVPGDVGTYGGVVTDVHGRVLREDGTPIARLYATGTTTASVIGRIYPGAGSSIGPSFVFGYLAAKHAAERVR
jgi:succinate dehydrogenase/fumarate reductase flavoprotein subunit